MTPSRGSRPERSPRRPGPRRPRGATGGRSARIRSVSSPTRGAGPRTHPGVAAMWIDSPTWRITPGIGILDLRHAAVLEEEGIGQGLLRGADRLHRHPGRRGRRRPFVRGELAERFLHGGRELAQDQQLRGVHPHPGAVELEGAAADVGLQPALMDGVQHEARLGCPMMDPPAVTGAEESVGHPGIGDPHAVARSVGVCDPLPGERAVDQRALEQ